MTYKLLSSLHKRAHQQCGHDHLLSLLLGLMDHPRREEKDHTSSHIGISPRSTWSETKLPQNTFGGPITHLGSFHQGTRPRINPCIKQGFPRTHLGTYINHQGTHPRINPSIGQGFPRTHPGALEQI